MNGFTVNQYKDMINRVIITMVNFFVSFSSIELEVQTAVTFWRHSFDDSFDVERQN